MKITLHWAKEDDFRKISDVSMEVDEGITAPDFVREVVFPIMMLMGYHHQSFYDACLEIGGEGIEKETDKEEA